MDRTEERAQAPVDYGFVIDNRKCIGCHACTTACKSENQVPVGVNRTWVKYVEKGRFPDTRRHFQVTRCNHCANPPCVRICPVTAMFQRADGIVDFDPEVCIGCKACMQACPYDAIYIDPENDTAAKCHYCAHRTEVGLEPACVVVCPEHAIISGDLNDPASEISRLVSRHQVNVRKPEQGTAPKLFYIDGDELALTPTASRVPGTFSTTDPATEQARTLAEEGRGAGRSEGSAPDAGAAGGGKAGGGRSPRTAPSGAEIRDPARQGAGAGGGPIHVGRGRMAGQMVQTAYDAQHEIPWHWQVPAYLVTKGIGSGIFLLLALIFGLGLAPFDPAVGVVGGLASLLFIGLTTGLLVWDLERPERFYTILTRPQWSSWLTRGAFVLIGFTAVAGAWTALELLGAAATGFDATGGGSRGGLAGGAWIGNLGVFAGAGGAGGIAWEALAAGARPGLLLAGGVLALASAVYTAFLFGQAEGRDLWQSTLLPGHLVVQALMVGAGTLLALGVFMELPPGMTEALLWIFGVGLVVDLGVTLLGEFGMPHASETAARAARKITHGPYRWHFWGGSVLLGHLAPLALLGAGILAGAPLNHLALLGAVGGILSIVGLYLFEHAFVLAPQEIPNS